MTFLVPILAILLANRGLERDRKTLCDQGNA